MKFTLNEYLPILMFFILSIVLSIVFLMLSFFIGVRRPDSEKLSAYECGFEAFDDSRQQFDVRFYLVAILFVIFDLEVAFLFPWATSLSAIGLFGFWSMMIFLSILTVGFIYEWKKGALEWD
ncbi:NADH-quinone oxidoreductase subunit A [Candidatus Endolissoclinum faulkneri]|nr:NADH-quinone oxidoreductase subunit A [Candidatus Endolissoclinum faulkneri]